MGRRGPKPTGIAKKGLIALVLATIEENPTWEFTGPLMGDILGCRADVAAMYLSRLARAKKIAKVKQGIYRGLAA